MVKLPIFAILYTKSGVTLNEIVVYTVDRQGQRKFVDRTTKELEAEPMRKIIHLKDFLVYLKSFHLALESHIIGLLNY